MTDYTLDFVGPGAALLSSAVGQAEIAASAAQSAEAGAEAALAQTSTALAGATAQADRAELAVSSVSGTDNFYPSQAAGEAAVPNGVFTTVDGGNNLIYIKRVAGVSTTITPGAFATLTGTQTLSGKTFAGATAFATNGSRIGITDDSAPITPQALVNIVNKGSTTNGLRVTSYWTGALGSEYQNNDNSLWEVFNRITSTSLNRSWSGSFANAYNDIPLGVTDSGERTGIIGWAVSVDVPGYNHAGTLEQQLGVYGVAGFQGPGSAATAVINNATGVRGYIYNDSVGSTITLAKAGEFISVANTGTVQTNYAVYAQAANGTVANYAFYGDGGLFYNSGLALFGATTSQSSPAMAARKVGNALEFGHPDPGGYVSTIGASFVSGYPCVNFCCEVAPTGDKWTTRGKKGFVITSLLAGDLVFGQIPLANSANQSLSEVARFTADKHLSLQETIILRSKTPASATATGLQGEVAWDASYIYVCTATNTWKRVAIATW